MQLIDGKIVSTEVLEKLKGKVSLLKTAHNLVPGLAVVIVGDDPASQVYVRNKVKTATELGMYSLRHELPKNSTQQEVLELIQMLNADNAIHGLLVQSPPPRHIDERAIIEAIDPGKDVDCFHPVNVGKLLVGDEDGLLPCTPAGVMELIRHYAIPTAGKHAVVIGRSNIVGKPMAVLLSRKSPTADCTVTLCHSRTINIQNLCRQADIIVAAIGRPHFVTADMVKNGAVVIDVGMNRIEDASKKSGYRLTGDVDFDAVAPKTSFITPVPGGVGLMTIAMLLTNTYKACCRQNGIPGD
jgi:methylenetetrahydrofolate dehydrogenase (NADP+)/methenyltetrahydrofolate cyclohydrolase